ncbi:MAG: YSC84-related protein [Burkholderiaceae bacterium]
MKPIPSGPARPQTAGLLLALALGAAGLAGCTTTLDNAPPPASSSSFSTAAKLDAAVSATLQRLYTVAPGSREMVRHAAGVLVFPEVIGGALIVGAEHGRGALRVGGHTAGYYSTTGASLGWQVGGQSKSVVYVFSTREALNKFQSSKGWTAGADATVAIGKVSANGSVDSETVHQPVVSFVMNNVGLEVGVSLTGSKISPITL